jgi:hypothetical protein
LLFNFTLEYAINRVQANQEGLKLNVTHQFLVYADDVNILDGSIYTTRKNTEALLIASKEIGLEENAEKTKHMVMLRDQNAGKIAAYREVINALKLWNSLNKLRAD